MREVAARKTRLSLRPSQGSLGVGGVLAACWYAGASQGNGTAFLLAFVVLALWGASAGMTFGAIRNATLHVELPGEIFATKKTPFRVRLEQTSATGFLFTNGEDRIIWNSLFRSPPGRESVILHKQWPKRGWHLFGSVSFVTRFPLGFWVGRAEFTMDQRVLVFPAPTGERTFPEQGIAETEGRHRGAAIVASGDYSGVRPSRLGDSQRQIDWKAVARGHGLFVKRFDEMPPRRLLLRLADARGDLEMRLRQLTLWTLEAARSGLLHGVDLDGTLIGPSRGQPHRRRVLKALAEYA